MKNYKSSIILSILFAFLSLAIISCSEKSDTASTDTEKKESAGNTKVESSTDTLSGEEEKEVGITQKQYNAINIQLGTFEKKNLANVLKATGFLSVPPQSKASITSYLGGTVKSIFVQEGNAVRKGQTLATIANPEFVRMQQDYLDAQAQLSFAQANYTRQQELSKENVTAKRVFQEAEANYKSLQAKVNSLQSQFGLIGINTSSLKAGNILSSFSVTSPISGNVAKINVNIGLTIDPSSVLLQVVDNAHLHLDLFVYEQDLPKVKVGQNIDFALTNLPGKNFTAKIYSIGTAFENDTKTIPIHAEITSPRAELIEGMNVTGLINVGSDLTSAVLSTAIANYSGSDYIFVQRSNGDSAYKFERIKIKKGITNGGYTEVTPLETIQDDAKIVTNGAFYLMAILTNAGEEE